MYNKNCLFIRIHILYKNFPLPGCIQFLSHSLLFLSQREISSSACPFRQISMAGEWEFFGQHN